MLAFGKDGNVFALDRNNLGGIGTQRAVRRVMNGPIVNASAAVTTPAGTFVTVHGHRNATALNCPRGSGDLATVRLSGGTSLTVRWCVTQFAICTMPGVNDMDLLRNVELFDRFSDEDHRRLADAADRMELIRNDVVFGEGDGALERDHSSEQAAHHERPVHVGQG